MTRPPSALGTEFGRALETMMVVPGALGAVLSDDRGYAVDFVREPEKLSELDVQIIGAQLGQALERLSATTRKYELGPPVILVEGKRRALLAAPLVLGYGTALLIARPTNVARALAVFGRGRRKLDELLDA